MITVTCYPADFNLIPTMPVIKDFSFGGESLNNIFLNASGAAQINVVVDWSRRGNFPKNVNLTGVDEDDLMTALSGLLGPATPGAAPAVGLLIADNFIGTGIPPGQFGVMFDLDGQNGFYGPRQGCAIFLNPLIGALPDGVGVSDPMFSEFVSYTAIHELGHAFNLWHVSDGSFMQPTLSPANLGHVGFNNDHSRYLASANDPAAAPDVLPGLSLFGVRQPPAPQGYDNPYLGPPVKDPNIKLEIRLSHRRFWPFEPVELEIEVSLAKAGMESCIVPDEFHPGYHNAFQIWIVRPDGGRFRFRPQIRFCHSNTKMQIRATESFQRTFPIFCQGGDYTFGIPGRYSIEVSWTYQASVYFSNSIDCEVLPPDPASKNWAMANSILQATEIRKLLRHKSRLPAHHQYEAILEFASKHASRETASTIHYALGCAAQLNRGGGWIDAMRKLSEKHLRKSLDLLEANSHQKEIIASLFREGSVMTRRAAKGRKTSVSKHA